MRKKRQNTILIKPKAKGFTMKNLFEKFVKQQPVISETEINADTSKLSTIARLKREKEACMGRYYNDGHKSGFEWAQTADFKSLLVAADWSRTPVDYQLTISDTIPDEFVDELCADGMFQDIAQISDERRDSWLEGSLMQCRSFLTA